MSIDSQPETSVPASTEAVRLRPEVATILATEHWSLLGTRSMTWNEVMSRITIHLTVLSAFLVVLALVAQATGFGPPFKVLSIGFAATALILGSLTSLRVNSATQEDLQLVRAMNRLRNAYVQLAPEITPFLTTSTHDDDAGHLHTLALGRQRHLPAIIIGSTSFFLFVVNTLVAGTLGALIADAAGASTAWTVVVGVAAAIVHVCVVVGLTWWFYGGPLEDVRFPSPGPRTGKG